MEVSLAFPQVLFHEKLENFTQLKDELIAAVYKLKDKTREGSLPIVEEVGNPKIVQWNLNNL